MADKWKNTTFAQNGEHVSITDRLEPYKGEFGIYKPKFKGRYENEYPNRWHDYIIQTLMLFPLYAVIGLTFWGFVVWGLADPLSFGWTNFAVFCGFVAMILILVWIFGAQRRKIEREFIAKKYHENTEKKKRKQAEAEQNALLLREYRKATTNVWDDAPFGGAQEKVNLK